MNTVAPRSTHLTPKGLPYPDATEPVAQGAAAIQALAEAVDPLVEVAGWIASTLAWTFGAADGHTFTMTTPGDHTADVSLGSRVRLTHAGVTKYFLVTGVAYASGTTTLTLYGGTDYTLAATAITAVSFSRAKAPAGFPLDPDKWTEVTTSTAMLAQTTPTAGVWYNVGGLSLVVPIGAWRVSFHAAVEVVSAAVTGNYEIVGIGSLSTANNTSVADRSGFFRHYSYVNASAQIGGFTLEGDNVTVLAAKQTLYLVASATTGAPSLQGLYVRGDMTTTILRAVSAYL